MVKREKLKNIELADVKGISRRYELELKKHEDEIERKRIAEETVSNLIDQSASN